MTSALKKILVVGGAGYIGSHAVKALRVAGHEVVVLDNLSAGHRQAVGDAAFVEADVRDSTTVRATLRDHNIDAVMHFAALLSVSESMSEPSRYYEWNVRGSLALLDAMVVEGALEQGPVGVTQVCEIKVGQRCAKSCV